MEINIDISDVFDLANDVVDLCKSKKLISLADAISESYKELYEADAKARRDKSAAIIIYINTIDSNLRLIKFEYNKAKGDSNNAIPFIDDYIAKLESKREELVKQKNKL